MRTRINTIQINGKHMPITTHKTFFGECRAAVLATSETPQHAQSNIHKVLAHKKVLIRQNRTNPTPTASERREAYLTFGKAMYKSFYGLN